MIGKCTCREYQQSISQIEEMQESHIRRTGRGYTGAVMRYCPWCGKRLYPFTLKFICEHGVFFSNCAECQTLLLKGNVVWSSGTGTWVLEGVENE